MLGKDEMHLHVLYMYNYIGSHTQAAFFPLLRSENYAVT